ncbi:MAG: hypothetical protein HZB75_05140 [Candidatus Saccharibacteria bacterium]|nr:MAG: hypothetical protein HZB75_05140 [Candidatus Saccharibacteria bacterium]
MIDEAKRKQLVIAASVFLGVVILAFIGFLIFFRQDTASDLPPVEPATSDTQSTEQENAASTDLSSEETKKSVSYKNGTTFNGFDELNRYAVTSLRKSAIEYVLSNYATTTKADIYTFTPGSIKETPDGERTFLTFNVTDNKDATYKVELSYTFAADAYVRVFDKDNKIVATSPFDTD